MPSSTTTATILQLVTAEKPVEDVCPLMSLRRFIQFMFEANCSYGNTDANRVYNSGQLRRRCSNANIESRSFSVILRCITPSVSVHLCHNLYLFPSLASSETAHYKHFKIMKDLLYHLPHKTVPGACLRTTEAQNRKEAQRNWDIELRHSHSPGSFRFDGTASLKPMRWYVATPNSCSVHFSVQMQTVSFRSNLIASRRRLWESNLEIGSLICNSTKNSWLLSSSPIHVLHHLRT